MRVLFLTSHRALRAATGSSIRVRELALGLAERGNQVTVLSLVSPRTSNRELAKYHRGVLFLEKKNWFQWGGPLTRLGWLPPAVLELKLNPLNGFFSFGIGTDYDWVVAETPWMWRAFRSKFPSRWVFSAHNNEADWYEPLFPQFTLGAVARKWVMTAECQAYLGADAAVFCTESDRVSFENRFGPRAHTAVVPNGFAVGFSNSPEKRRALKLQLGLPEACLLGLFIASRVHPNIEAVRILHAELSEIKTKHPWHILIAGSVCDAFTSLGADFTLLGQVESVGSLLEGADLAVNPAVGGSGSQLKVIEALGAGLPVLTTAQGARGFSQLRGVHLAERGSFARTLVETSQWQSPLRAQTDAFSWSEIARAYHDILSR